MPDCMHCGRNLESDEIALHKRIFNRGAEKFMCIDCCAEYLNIPVDMLEEKIEYFKSIGCTLFEN